MRCAPSAKRRRDDRQPDRRHERRREPVTKRARTSTQPSCARPPSPENATKTASAEEHPPPAEEVADAAAEQHKPAVAEDVGADDPLQRGGRHAEVGADRRQGDAHHGDVGALEEDGAAQDEQSAQDCDAVPPIVAPVAEGGRGSHLVPLCGHMMRHYARTWKTALQSQPVTAREPRRPDDALQWDAPRGLRGPPDPRPFADKWSLLVVALLDDRMLRFSELRREIDGSASGC